MTSEHAGTSRIAADRTDEDLLNQGFVRIMQTRDDWLRIAGWIEGQRRDAHAPQPSFVMRLAASIEDAI